MPDIERGLRLLAEHKIDCVIIGGVAAGAHGSSYETSDVDACYARDPEKMFGHRFSVLSLEKLIAAKRSAGRAKDLLVLPGLEAILEYEMSNKVDL